MIIKNSPNYSCFSQRQTSCRLGAFLLVNLDRDAVLHQTVPHYRAGVEQEREYDTLPPPSPVFNCLLFVAIHHRFGLFSLPLTSACYCSCVFIRFPLVAVIFLHPASYYCLLFASTSIFSDRAVRLHKPLQRAWRTWMNEWGFLQPFFSKSTNSVSLTHTHMHRRTHARMHTLCCLWMSALGLPGLYSYWIPKIVMAGNQQLYQTDRILTGTSEYFVFFT